jgi:phosphoribosylanthranilate isomerase
VDVKVKICGITTVGDARAAVELGADALGFNFYEHSPRYLAPARAREIVRTLPSGTCTVGVFVNAPREVVGRVVEEVGLTAIQLHGDEPPDACEGWGQVVVLKALRAGAPDLATRAAGYRVRYVLVDAPSSGWGGSGRTFDWEAAAGIPRERLVVAGGLDPTNVVDAIRTLRPAGVDVASGVEHSPGRKDHGKLQAFISAAKEA